LSIDYFITSVRYFITSVRYFITSVRYFITSVRYFITSVRYFSFFYAFLGFGFSSLPLSARFWGPTIFLFKRYRGPFRQSKATEVCSYHPLSCIPEVKNQGSFTSGHPCMAWFLT